MPYSAPAKAIPHSIYTIFEELHIRATTSRGLGDSFERLIKQYLRLDPKYYARFSDVWLWQEWPKRGNQPDTGIDLVAKERFTGDLCAIQCKFYNPAHNLQKSDIDSFFTASGKEPFSSRIVISTCDNWSKHAEEALTNQQIPVERISTHNLAASPVNWSCFSLDAIEASMALLPKHELRPHQQTAFADVVEGLQTAVRGKLIMACGTGKTLTALRLAEHFGMREKTSSHSQQPANREHGGMVLLLVPSLSLMSQALREWTAQAKVPMQSFAVCSDSQVGRNSEEDISPHDLGFPATTDPKTLMLQMAKIGKLYTEPHMTVVFSTYHSIETLSLAQKEYGLPAFDLIICDEAHRTTGYREAGEDVSHFVKVHDNGHIQGAKRLYMTATPRMYKEEDRQKASENDVLVWSMDDAAIFGETLHTLSFSKAVQEDLLADYTVLVLTIDEGFINRTLQKSFVSADGDVEIPSDAARIIGCWNALAKRNIAQEGISSADEAENVLKQDPTPMRRAVAFSQNIKISKIIEKQFAEVVEAFAKTQPNADKLLRCEIAHVDGTMNAIERNRHLSWLKEESPNSTGNTCRILTNVRCLSEGVDVPALDAVMFLHPRRSVTDVVQAVGRVMRKAPGKKTGYIILPVVIPAGEDVECAMKNNKRFEVVWEVLQALQAHDDSFNDWINLLELNQEKPTKVQHAHLGEGFEQDSDDGTNPAEKKTDSTATMLSLLDNQWGNALFVRIAKKFQDKKFWRNWAKEITEIAERTKMRIEILLENPEYSQAFAEFLSNLQATLNPNVKKQEAIEMLCQHMVTAPVFNALFADYAFSEQNPVSIAMQNMLNILNRNSVTRGDSAEQQKLDSFFAAVQRKVLSIDNAAGRQTVITGLYDDFFKIAFPKQAEKLGIVYTPVEVVDFIVQSVEHAQQTEFTASVSDERVHVLDPFTGTGTFIVRLLQSGLIKNADLPRKFKHELHANEILLLPYYIAAINIEEAYHTALYGDSKAKPRELDPFGLPIDKMPIDEVSIEAHNSTYTPFEGMVLTDTFQMREAYYATASKGKYMGGENQYFAKNSERANLQNKADITVIIGNPPYSAGQKNENDDSKNEKYPHLDEKIKNTYAKDSSATLKNSLYDSYIRAIRWATDRLPTNGKGIVCYVSNGSFIDNNAMSGLRKHLAQDFSSIYCFNLRGNQRTSGELSRREGGKIFDSGSRAPIAITLLVRNPEKYNSKNPVPCPIYYHDIGDYLNREQKLAKIGEFASAKCVPWQTLTPNAHFDWIDHRSADFTSFMPLGDKRGSGKKVMFTVYSSGVKTNRDAWVYNFSQKAVSRNMTNMIDFYNQQAQESKQENFIRSNDTNKISWDGTLVSQMEKGHTFKFLQQNLACSLYRPFHKEYLYFDKFFNNSVYQMPKLFPAGKENLAIAVTGAGSTKPFSALITNTLPDLELISKSQCFPLYYYEDTVKKGTYTDQGILTTPASTAPKTRKDAISDAALEGFHKKYNTKSISKEDIFFYVYGLLHSPEYKERYASDLKKMLPHIPFVKNLDTFQLFNRAGRELAKWHLNYETIEPFPENSPYFVREVHTDPAKAPQTSAILINASEEQKAALHAYYHVEKMKFASKIDLSTLVFNSRVSLSNIPKQAHGVFSKWALCP